MSFDLLDIVDAAPFFVLEEVAAVEPTLDFWSALRDRLVAVPGLDDLDDVYVGTPGDDLRFPSLVISPLYDTIAENGTDAYILERAAQFDVFATDGRVATNARALAAFRALLWRAENPPLEFMDGYEITRQPSRYVAAVRQQEASVGGRNLYAARFEATFLIGEGGD